MMALNCETVRDRLPDVLAGAVVGPEAQAVLAHVAECAACADEAALIGALQRSPERAPAALSAHIRQAPVRRAWLGRPDLRRSALLAAAVGSVLLGGSLLMRGLGSRAAGTGGDGRARALAPGATTTVARPASGSGATPLAVSGTHAPATPSDGRALMQALPGTPDAGLYSSTGTLEDLSEEELNTLLKELQS